MVYNRELAIGFLNLPICCPCLDSKDLRSRKMMWLPEYMDENYLQHLSGATCLLYVRKALAFLTENGLYCSMIPCTNT